MENKIILELAKKEIEDLKLLVETLEKKPLPDQFFIDIALSKAKTLVQEFSLLEGSSNVKYEEQKKQINIPVERNLTQATEIEVPKVAEIVETSISFEEVKISNELIEDKLKEEKSTKEDKKTTEPEIVFETIVDSEKLEAKTILEEEMQQSIDTNLAEVTTEAESQKEQINEVENKESIVAEEELEHKDSEEKHLKIIGEQYKKEPTLNELLASNHTESKIKGKPIGNIKSAIGLNDRFMYIRELFGNDSNQFNNAVNEIDEANSLIEAVEFLEKNFEWKKNETSLKFMDLVKRKFDT